MSNGIDLPTIGSKWTHASEPGVYVIADATTDGRIIWTEEGGNTEYVAPLREFIQVFTPLVESPITGPNYPAPQATGNTLSIAGKVLGQIPSQPASERHASTLNRAGVIGEAIVEDAAQRLTAAERVYFGPNVYAPHIATMLARAALEAAYPAIRQQVAEEIAAMLEGQRDPDGFDTVVNRNVFVKRLATKTRAIGNGTACTCGISADMNCPAGHGYNPEVE